MVISFFIFFSLRILVILVTIVVAFTFFVLNDAFKLFYVWRRWRCWWRKINTQLNLWFYLSNMHKLWLFVGRLFHVLSLHFEYRRGMDTGRGRERDAEEKKKYGFSWYACTPNWMFNFWLCICLRWLLWRFTTFSCSMQINERNANKMYWR